MQSHTNIFFYNSFSQVCNISGSVGNLKIKFKMYVSIYKWVTSKQILDEKQSINNNKVLIVWDKQKLF